MSRASYMDGKGRNTQFQTGSGLKATQTMISQPARSIWPQISGIRFLATIEFSLGILLCFKPWGWLAFAHPAWIRVDSTTAGQGRQRENDYLRVLCCAALGL